LAWLRATAPDREVRDSAQAVTLARQCTHLAPDYRNCWNTLGVALYRSGKWRDSLKALAMSMELPGGGDAYDLFFAAMAYWQLGEKGKARQGYSEATAWMDEHKPEDEELKRFRAEAEEVLGIK
jgi:uncharacterized protein HemY